jgi:glucose/arabinose dehydrogenase
MRRSGGLLLALAMAMTLLPAVAASAGPPDDFREVTVLRGLTNPTAVEFLPDGAVLVAEKSGLVQRFDSLTDTSPTVIADLRRQVHNFWDRGLLDIAVHPDPATPYLYALYTHDAPVGGTAPRWGTAAGVGDPCPSPPGATGDGCVVSGRLSRLPLRADGTGAEQVLIEDWCQQYPSHSVGALAFGSDGALYVSGGDGASFTFADYGQKGAPVNPCGDPPGAAGSALTPPSAEGGALRSQDLRTTGDPLGLDGAVLRVDPATGLGLADNPLAGSADVNARRVIAHGLRNPFRFALRPGTDEVWLGDVGWGGFEEVNRIADANDATVENFGWPCYEGDQQQSAYAGAGLSICQGLAPGSVTPPTISYRHNQDIAPGVCRAGSSSVSGVAFYEGGRYPDAYDGALFYADYSRKCIMVAPRGANGLPDPAQARPFVTEAAGPVALTTGPGGDLYYVDLGGGTVRRIEYIGQEMPVVCPAGQFLAQYFANRTLSGSPAIQRCEAEIQHDWGIGPPVPGVPADDFSVRWTGRPTFPGGNVAFTAIADDGVRMRLDGETVIDGWKDQAVTRYDAQRQVPAGQHDIVVEYYEATEDAVARFGWQQTVAQEAPVATIAAPTGEQPWRVGDTVAFSGGATDAQDGTLGAASLTWTLLLHHCPSTCHVHPIEEFPGVAGGAFPAPDHDHPSWLELQLTATDSSGRTGTDSVRLDPATVELVFRSQPEGLRLAVGSQVATTPFSRTVIAGSLNSVSAPSPQQLGTVGHTFRAWSDGGEQSHTITAVAGATYTATYDPPPPTCATGQYLADYFGNRTLSGAPAVTRCEATIDHNWGAAALVPGIGADNASARWTSTQTFPGGDVRFRATADDGVRVLLDGVVVLNGWKDQAATTYEATVPVSAGAHRVTVEYYEATGDAVARFGWEPVGAAVTCAAGEYRAEYFRNRTLTGTPAAVRCEPTIDRSWGGAAPLPGFSADNFSVRWTGRPAFPGGDVRFRVTGDDGIRMRLDGTTVIDGWRNQAATTYERVVPVAAGAHDVVVEYYEASGNAVARFGWEAVGPAPACAAGEFRAEYFRNRTLTGAPAAVRCEPAVDRNWGTGAPLPGFDANNFSVRWTATRSFPGGATTFRATGDDGIRIRLDGATVVDGWKDQAATAYQRTVPVAAGAHQVVVEYYEAYGDAVARASWTGA